MKKHLLSLVFFIGIVSINAQTKTELETQKAEKQAQADTAQAEANAIQAQIDALPGWKIGAFGTIGGSLSSFKNWYAQGTPNNESGNIGFTFNGYANLIKEKFFWRNALTTNLNWVKLDNKDNPSDDSSFNPTTDIFNITSLYGRNITKTVAASAFLEYRTTLLDNFNDPGYLDLGIGATWTPIENLIVVINPLNYNLVFSDGETIFESSLGAKIMVDYAKQIGAINFKTNFSTFQSYKNSNFSNWTWTNSFGYTLWKMIGIGFDFGLRNNKQEALHYALAQTPVTATSFNDVDNKLQSYYTFGLSYNF